MLRKWPTYCLLSIIILTTPVKPADLRLIDAKKGDNWADIFGDACEGLGDINGDGYNDFLTTTFKSRELYLYLGGPSPFDSLPQITWTNHGSRWGSFSFSPVNVGDVDCDGVNDFISLFGNDDTLKLFLGLENLDPDDYLVLCSDCGDFRDFIIGGGGDNDNDDRFDFWIYKRGNPRYDSILGYSGCDLLDQTPDHIIYPDVDPDYYYSTLGRELCVTCDLNGDSIPEIIYGQYNGTGSGPPGRVCIVCGGSALSSTADLMFYAPNEHTGYRDFGKDLACLGDISGDGIDDLWVSQGGRN